MRVYICTGHAQYSDFVISSADGTSVGGCNEYLYNKELMKYIETWLEYAGVECVIDTPDIGKCKCLNDEINYYCGNANFEPYDLVVQLHLNSFDSTANGCEVWYYPYSKGKKYAESICDKLATVWNNRGAKNSESLYWLKNTNSTAVLIESFFCDSASDYQWARNIGYEKHAKLIAEGIVGHEIVKPNDSYSVLVGAYSTRKEAKKAAQKLKESGYKVELVRR